MGREKGQETSPTVLRSRERGGPFDFAQGKLRPALHNHSLKPCEQTKLEFFWGRADRAAVIGGGDFPELCSGRVDMDQARVPDGNVAVDLAVNQKNWNCACGD